MLTNVPTHHVTLMPLASTQMVHSAVHVRMVSMVMAHSALISMNVLITNSNVLPRNPATIPLAVTNAPVVKDTLVLVVIAKMSMNVKTVHAMPMPAVPIPTVVSNANVTLDSMALVNHVTISTNVLLESMNVMSMLAAATLMVVTNVHAMLDGKVTDTFALI